MDQIDLVINFTLYFDFNNTNDDNNTSKMAISYPTGPYSLARIILDWLNLYYLGFIIIFGLLGNAYNVLTFVRTKKKLRSPSYYLAALALNDVIFLAILLILWLGQFKIDLFTHPGLYQTLYFLSSSSSCISGTTILIHFLIVLCLIIGFVSNICSLARGCIYL